jgi:hypothetical protein
VRTENTYVSLLVYSGFPFDCCSTTKCTPGSLQWILVIYLTETVGLKSLDLFLCACNFSGLKKQDAQMDKILL